MNLPIDYLRTFIAVADTKGFTKAGIQVNRSQSAVSMQIKRLEDEIGNPLFERIGKTVKLTTEGGLLINYARRIVKEHDDAVMVKRRCHGSAISGQGISDPGEANQAGENGLINHACH